VPLDVSETTTSETAMIDTPSHDPRLLDLKRVAEAGSDCGLPYDRGTSSVIVEIVDKKCFVHNPFATDILRVARERKQNAGATIPAGIQEFLDANGWTLEEGVDYARGVEYAEHELDKFRIALSDED